MNKRIGIYTIKDDCGVWDEYIFYYLKSISMHLKKIIVVYKAEPKTGYTEKLKEQLTQLQIEFFNLFDNRLGDHIINESENFDQLVFMDDSVFGPFYDIKEIFNYMDELDCDFWGISQQNAMLDEYENVIKPYIKPYFISVGSKLLHGEEFSKYIIEHKNNYNVDGSFTWQMEKVGYKWEVFSKPTEYLKEKPGYNVDCDIFACYEMIKKHKSPFIMCENFKNTKGLEVGFRESLREAFEFIDKYTNYDVELIWKHILRKYNIADIKESLHLNYVVSADTEYNNSTINKNTALVFHMYYGDLLDESLSYVFNMPEEIDVFITTNGNEQKNYIENKLTSAGRKHVKVLLAGKRGRDAGSLLVECRNYLMKYEYLCFVHDKKTTGGSGPVTVGEAFRKHICENTVKNSAFVKNVIQLFEDNPRMGLLTPPVPAIGGYLTELVGNEWTCCFEPTVELAKELNLKAPIEKEKPPFALSTAFWCRTAAMKPLFEKEWNYEDFPEEPLASDGALNHAIERILIYVAQSEGYFSGILQNNEYASLFVTNTVSVMTKLVSDMRDTFEMVSVLNFKDFFNDIFDMSKFCWNHKEIVIYGAGNIASHISKVMAKLGINFECFIVSERGGNPYEKDGHPVKELKDIINKKDSIGVIVALNKQNQSEVNPILRNLGFDFYSIY